MRIDFYLILQIIVSLWASIASSASVYTFSLFAPALRQAPHNFSDADISTIAAFFVFATFVNQPAGFLYDYFGPRVTIWCGCVIMTLSWILLSFFIFVDNEQLQIDKALTMMNVNKTSGIYNSSSLSSTPHFITFLFMLPPFAAAFNEVGGVLGQLKQFQLQSSFIIILQKVFIGLGASIVGAVFAAFWAPSLSHYVTVTVNVTVGGGIIQEQTRTLIETLPPYSSFCNILALYSLCSVGLFGFMIGHRNQEPCPGLTSPPVQFSSLYKKLMMRGEYCLYLGILLLTGGNLVVVWTTSDSSSSSTSSTNVIHVRRFVAVVAILFPFSFLSMLKALPSQTNLDEMTKKTQQQLETKNEKGEEEKSNVPGNQHQHHEQQQSSDDELVTISASKHESKNYIVVKDGLLLLRKRFDENGNHSSNNDPENPQLQLEEQDDTALAVNVNFDLKTILQQIGRNLTSSIESNNDTQKHHLAGGNGDVLEVYDLSPPANSKDIFHNIRKIELWMMWWIAFVVWGTCTMIYSNSSSIYRALPGHAITNTSTKSEQRLVLLPFNPSLNAILVAVTGVGNALGRAVAGRFIPILRSRRESSSGSGKVLHPMLMVPPIGAMLACALLLVSEGSGLWLPLFMTGLTIGFAWASLILITKEIFVLGGQHYSFLYTAGNLTPFLFVLVLFKGSFKFYEEKQRQQINANVSSSSSSSTTTTTSCVGRECIEVPMIVCILLNVSAFVVANVLRRRIDQGCFDDDVDDDLVDGRVKETIIQEEVIVKERA